MTQYQNQTRIVKAYRWLKYKPLYMFYAIAKILKWLFKGAKIEEPRLFPTRWRYIKHIWIIYQSLADYEMGYYWTLEEILGYKRGWNE